MVRAKGDPGTCRACGESGHLSGRDGGACSPSAVGMRMVDRGVPVMEAAKAVGITYQCLYAALARRRRRASGGG